MLLRQANPLQPALLRFVVQYRRLLSGTSATRRITYGQLELIRSFSDPEQVSYVQQLGSLDAFAVDLDLATGNGFRCQPAGLEACS